MSGPGTGAFSTVDGPTTEEQVEAVFAEFGEAEPPVVIVVASESHRAAMQPAEDEFASRGIEFHTILASSPQFAVRFAETAALRGVRVIISGSSHNAPLTTLLALNCELPVIGVPLSSGALGGLDALISTAQSTPGSPAACMPIDGARPAAIFATYILNALPLAPR